MAGRCAVELHVDDGADDLRDLAGDVGLDVHDLASLERLGARNDFDQFLGDLRLARAVVAQRQRVDDVAGVARRRIHRRHARALLGRLVLEQRAEDLHRDIARQQIGQDLCFVRLVFVGAALEVGGLRARSAPRPGSSAAPSGSG